MIARRLSLIALSAALFSQGALAESSEQPPGAGRQRIPFERLSEDSKPLYLICEKTEKTIAATKDIAKRKELARSLQEGAQGLAGDYPDLFRAWMWQAQSALVLNEETEAKNAAQNMKDLGALESGNPQILAVVKLVDERVWKEEKEEPQEKHPRKSVKTDVAAASKKPVKQHARRSSSPEKPAHEELPSAAKLLGL